MKTTINFKGRIFRVRQHPVTSPDGIRRLFESVQRPPGVRVIVHDDREILLTREWRHELNCFDYRLPGGKVCDSISKWDSTLKKTSSLEALALVAAQRELREETGLDLETKLFRHVHTSCCGSTVEWDLYFYRCYVTKLKTLFNFFRQKQELDVGEDIHPLLMPFASVADIVCSRRMSEDRSSAEVFRLLWSRPPHLKPPRRSTKNRPATGM